MAGRMIDTARGITAAALLGASLLAACGGSGGGGAGGGTLAGTAVEGPVANATVTAFAVTGGARGAQLATATTDAHGNFTMGLGTYAGTVLVEVRGGSFTDAATDTTMSMGGSDVMTGVMPGFAEGSSATMEVTPLTSMAQAMAQGMPGGMTDENATTANDRVGSYFSVADILHMRPVDPLVNGSSIGASPDQKNYGMTLGAMSRYALTLGMTTSSGMITAFMEDATDGVLDGMTGSTPIPMAGLGGMMGGTMPPASGTSALATAMEQFVASSLNRSGVTLTEMQPLIAKLASASGAIQ